MGAPEPPLFPVLFQHPHLLEPQYLQKHQQFLAQQAAVHITCGSQLVAVGFKATMGDTQILAHTALAETMHMVASAMDMVERDMEAVAVANLPTPQQNADSIATTAPYQALRRAYYDRFPAFWGTLPGEHREEYALYGALEVSREHASILRIASSRLYQLMTRLALVLQQADDQSLLDIGIPLSALPYAHLVMPDMPAVMCGRFEFAWTAEGPKLLEFNAETPTFVVELFHMNSQVCIDFGLVDPNVDSQEQLVRAMCSTINASLAWIGKHPTDSASVIFSAYANRKEERGTAEFYRDLLTARGDLPYRTGFCGLSELRITPDCLLTTDGERVDVLYKLYPTEHLIEDEASDGTIVGLALLELVRKRQLAIINPPIAFVLQNKALMALLWAMHLVKSELFTSEEHTWIEQYVLPSYFDAHDIQGQSLFIGPYVVKPVYGREGGSITIRNGHDIVGQSEQNLYEKQLMMYQQYAALPTTIIQTEEGPTEVQLVHNCFVVDGTPSAIGVRASTKLIFDDNAYFVPICHPLRFGESASVT